MGLFERVATRLFPLDGREVLGQVRLSEKIDRQVSLSEEIGSPGTSIYHGFIAQDYNPNFRGQKAIKIYEEMRNQDATVAAVLKAIKLPILQAEWQVESGDAQDETQNEIADFVRRNLEKLEGGFTQFLRESMGYLDFGFYYFEKVYQVKDGMIVIKKLAPRLPSAHSLWRTSDPEVPGVTQFLPTVPEGKKDFKINPEIPMSKLVLFTNNKEGDNWEGVSVLRTAYKHWYMKDALYRIATIKLERGAGILKITLPDGATPTDRTNARELGENFKVNEQAYIVVPGKEWNVELMTAGIADQSGASAETINHHNREITLNILAQFLDLGSGSTGSYALSKDQTDFFGLSLRAIADYMAGVLNDQLIKELVDLNFGEQKEYPKFVFSKIGENDYTELSATLEKLVSTGLIKVDPQLKVWVHKQFGLPEVSVEDFEEEEKREPVQEEKEEEEPQKHNGFPGLPRAGGEEDEHMEKPEEGEMAEKKYFRPLTFAEGRVKFAEVEAFFDDEEEDIEETLGTFTQQQRDKLMRDAARIIETQNVAAIAGISLLGAGALLSKIKENAKNALERGKATAAKEISTSIPTTTAFTKRVLDTKVDILLDQRQRRIEDTVKGILLDSLNNEIGKTATLNQLGKSIDSAFRSEDSRIAGKIVVDFFDEGRALTFEKDKASLHGLQRSEVLDDKTCPMCMTVDGQVLGVDDPFTKIGEVHDHCRGIWVGILRSDAELPKVKELPKFIKNRFDSMEGVPRANAFEQLKTPIVRKGSRLERKIKDGELEI